MSEQTIACPKCGGAGNIIDPDVYADRRQVITCPTCHGRRKVAQAPKVPCKLYHPETSDVYHAAVIFEPMERSQVDRIYKRLVPEARQQIRLAKKWGVWGVLASDAWTFDHQSLKNAP